MPLEEADESRLRDMLVHARDAIALLAGRSLDQMTAELAIRLAVVRCIEVIGEAGHRVSADVQRQLPTIPWPMMWNMRNRLIHDYGNTNYSIVHDVIIGDLPMLADHIEAFLNRSSSS